MQQYNANNCLNSDIWVKNDSQREYGCHTPQFTDTLREKECIHCRRRTPALLEELAFSVILENAKILEKLASTLCHLPHRICWLTGRALNGFSLHKTGPLVGFISEFGETRPSWYDADERMIIFLRRFQLLCKVYQKLKLYMGGQSAGIDDICQYVSNLNNIYEDFWSEMTSAMKKVKAETDNRGYLGLLKTLIYPGTYIWSKITSLITKLIAQTDKGDYLEPLKICADENKVVLIKATELATHSLLDRHEYESMKELQRLSKTFACPIVFKPTTIGLRDVKSDEIPHLLDDFDSEVISDVDLTKSPTWSGSDIDELGRVLSACNNLSSIYLRQNSTPNEVSEDVAPAISRLLSHHHQLKKIGLEGFNLEGTLASYPLPPVENLRLRLCIITEEDLDFMSNRSDLILKTLVVHPYFSDVHSPSSSIFIQNQAKSLENLELVYPSVSLIEISNLLRIMAKFNKLQVLDLRCTVEIDFVSIENIIVDLMSIHSTREFYIDFPTNSDESGLEAGINLLKDVVTELCKINRRPPITITLDIVEFI